MLVYNTLIVDVSEALGDALDDNEGDAVGVKLVMR